MMDSPWNLKLEMKLEKFNGYHCPNCQKTLPDHCIPNLSIVQRKLQFVSEGNGQQLNNSTSTNIHTFRRLREKTKLIFDPHHHHNNVLHNQKRLLAQTNRKNQNSKQLIGGPPPVHTQLMTKWQICLRRIHMMVHSLNSSNQ
ncbi:hypothetical protein BLNAU_1762 [Blattamonas nauphoetae]|uniref:Uncharacterized protein n=1 Tax=Blattamonas nauphoetae TaxID=2049346 RepID=A0ABQ9YI15_9EUKA|nr:hypothetical protein BLNAU_1762 [Blattamonas nauphoetae]